VLQGEQQAADVGVENGVVRLGGLSRQRPDAAGVAGVVDGRVEPAEDLDGPVDQRADVVLDRDVGADVLGPATQLPELGGERLAFSSRRPETTRDAPSRAKAVAVARPIPARAPVTNTTCSLIIAFPS
jgi:hypothetical protein